MVLISIEITRFFNDVSNIYQLEQQLDSYSYIDKPNIKMVSYYVCQQSYVSTTKLDYVKLQLLMMENLQKLKK